MENIQTIAQVYVEITIFMHLCTMITYVSVRSVIRQDGGMEMESIQTTAQDHVKIVTEDIHAKV